MVDSGPAAPGAHAAGGLSAGSAREPPFRPVPGPVGPGYRTTGPNPGAQVTIDLDKLWPGGQAFRLTSPHPVPREIQRSFLLWMAVAGLTAALVVRGVVGQLGTAGGSIGGSFVLFLFGAGLVYGAAMMRNGQRWARVLNVTLGCIASVVLLWCLSLIVGVFALFFAVAATGYGMSGSDIFALLLSGVSALVMLAILAAIMTATVYMFKRQANEYFASFPTT